MVTCGGKPSVVDLFTSEEHGSNYRRVQANGAELINNADAEGRAKNRCTPSQGQ